MSLLKGQSVSTTLGNGTVLGFEVFDSKGFPLPIVEDDPENGYRVIVRLDDPALWEGTELTPNPYISRSDIKVIVSDQTKFKG